MPRVFLVLYAPTSPQRLVDVARLAFSIPVVDAFVVVKPSGMAAQVGIPEVSKLAYKMGKSFVILPQLQDVVETLPVKKVLFIVHDENAEDLTSIEIPCEDLAIVVQGSELSFSKNDLALGIPVKLSFLERAPPIPASDAVLALYEVSKKCFSPETGHH